MFNILNINMASVLSTVFSVAESTQRQSLLPKNGDLHNQSFCGRNYCLTRSLNHLQMYDRITLSIGMQHYRSQTVAETTSCSVKLFNKRNKVLIHCQRENNYYCSNKIKQNLNKIFFLNFTYNLLPRLHIPVYIKLQYQWNSINKQQNKVLKARSFQAFLNLVVLWNEKILAWTHNWKCKSNRRKLCCGYYMLVISATFSNTQVKGL